MATNESDSGIPDFDWSQLRQKMLQGISSKDREAIGRICREFDIKDELLDEVILDLVYLRRRKRSIRYHARTVNERADEFERLKGAIDELTAAWVALHPSDRGQFDELVMSKASRSPKGIDNHVSAISYMSGAAEELLKRPDLKKTRGGRRPVQQTYAEAVGWLAKSAEASGIKLARGGNFENFCSQVFGIAEIGDSAESAVRAFLDSRKKLKQKAPG